MKIADLEAKVDELDRQLNLIYKYKPSLQYLERNVDVLQSIGLDDEQIRNVIRQGSTTIINTITNPQDGKEMAIFVPKRCVNLEMKQTLLLRILHSPCLENLSNGF